MRYDEKTEINEEVLRRVICGATVPTSIDIEEKGNEADAIRCFGNIKIDYSNLEVYVGDRLIGLSPREFEIFSYIAFFNHKHITSRELYENVMKESYSENCSSVIPSLIRKIRLKLEDDADNPKYIITDLKKGYRFITNGHVTKEEEG